MGVVAVVVGVALVLSVLADIVNTLVATQNAAGRYWLTRLVYYRSWAAVRAIGGRLGARPREALFAIYGPGSVLLLLTVWVAQQVLGFGLIWWGLGGVEGADSFGDAIYYSGVVYFTLGFGEIVPGDAVPRFGALVEAFSGVLTTALVIGYLPALYSAYSEREQKLLTLDDGSEERITPTNLVLSRCPSGDATGTDDFFAGWEAWVAQVLETHTTFPMLALFRSQHPGQNWLTALGLVTDAALHMQLMEPTPRRSSYWMLRRSIRLFHVLTEHADLTEYHQAHGQGPADGGPFFEELYTALEAGGFAMLPREQALAVTLEMRQCYAPQLEYLIDQLEAPRGFWGHRIGHQLESWTTSIVES